MRSPKFVNHYKLCGAQVLDLVAIHNHYEALDRYVVSVACIDAKLSIYRVLSFLRSGAASETCGFANVKVRGKRVEVQP